jgi:hypothetical protein|tara:strand:- start:797 stop:1192 length:396 start_codon:yes stop_codon:yes gene_type:complete
MRLLLILLSISLLTACGASNPTTNFSVATQYQANQSVTALGINSIKRNYYTVPRVAQQEYTRCTSFALRSMQVGEQCTWEVPGVAIGIVKLVQIDATGCHYMFNTMMYKNKQKHWQETACYNGSTKRWKFQ